MREASERARAHHGGDHAHDDGAEAVSVGSNSYEGRKADSLLPNMGK